MRPLLLLILLAVSASAQSGWSREQIFESVAQAEEARGDLGAAQWLRGMGAGSPVIPPELSARARWWYGDYAEKYDAHRQRLMRAILQPRHSEESQWRVDAAEAALHLVAYELEQGRRGSVPLVQKFLHEAWRALDHHIATTPFDMVEMVTPAPIPAAKIEAVPAIVAPGECAMIKWETWNATEAWINGQRVELSGWREVCPRATESYNLEAVGVGGKAIAWATVAVMGSPPTTPTPAPGRKFRIHFDFDQSVIRPDAIDTMAAVAAVLRTDPALNMRIEGHCDAIGTDDYNIGLGMRRAQSVRDFFVSRYGLSPTRFTLVSKGEREPIAPNTRPDGRDNPDGRALNRRAEFIEIR